MRYILITEPVKLVNLATGRFIMRQTEEKNQDGSVRLVEDDPWTMNRLLVEYVYRDAKLFGTVKDAKAAKRITKKLKTAIVGTYVGIESDDWQRVNQVLDKMEERDASFLCQLIDLIDAFQEAKETLPDEGQKDDTT